MGSEEFAIGKFPHEVVKAIKAVSTEVDIETDEMLKRKLKPRIVDMKADVDREKAAIMW
jgi:pyruvate kinase